MSDLPDFARGAGDFIIDTDPERPAVEQQHEERSRISPQYHRNNFNRGGSANYTPRQFHHYQRGFPGTPRNFTPRESSYQNFAPRRGYAVGGHFSTPHPRRGFTPGHSGFSQRPRRPNFSNPYEQQLTPRNYGPRQQRWQYTPRGGGTPLSTEFGPCAQGASPETLKNIDAFVNPSMLENPWRRLEERRSQGPSTPKKIKPQEGETSDEETPHTNEDEKEEEFDLKSFLPKA